MQEPASDLNPGPTLTPPNALPAPSSPPTLPTPPTVSTAPVRRRPWQLAAARWFLELATVFVGVYAAFLLNAHQTRHASELRREQILVYLENGLTKAARSLAASEASYNHETDEFLRQLDAGKMPPLVPLDWSTGSSPNDQNWLLEGGGLDLLEIDTVAALKDRDTVFTTDWNRISHFQHISDEQLYPHVGEPADFFYDPATHQLRPRFAYYPDVLRFGSQFFHDMHEVTARALAQIKKEQARRPR